MQMFGTPRDSPRGRRAGTRRPPETTKALDKKGIAYEVVDMSQDPAALERVRALGFMQAPVVTETDSWSGFRPDKIAELAESAAASVA